ncbi:MAG TPA: formyltransferase [Candidatus Binatia bacterium]|nr:formyltransferase [Candidatus Binatia bacterium]
MRTVVCAYSEVGHACLDELLAIGADLRLVVTHRDAPGESIWFASVAERARSAGVPVIAPEDPNAPEAVAEIAAVRPELLFSFYYRQMLRPAVLGLASAGALNLHGSLLPRYRGRAPVNWVLVNGESETGVTLHYMDEKPDHGDIVAQRRVAIARDDTALTLTRKLAAEARAVVRAAYPLLAAGRAPRWPQDHARSSYFGGRRPSDGAIDWRWPAERIRNLVRAVTDPWPGAFTTWSGEHLIVWWAETAPATAAEPGEMRLADGAPVVATGDGALALVAVGWRGRRMTGGEWAREAGVRDGGRLDAVAIDGAVAREARARVAASDEQIKERTA